MQFQVDGTDYGGPVGLQDGLAQLTTSELPAGQHSVAAFFSSSSTAFGNSDNGTAPLSQAVTPAPLTVTANDQQEPFGSPVPTLTATFAGFVNGEGPGVLGAPPAQRHCH